MDSKPTIAYWKIRGLIASIRYQLKYQGVDFDLKEYEVTDGPEFSRACWMDVKFTLGFDFPNLPYMIDGDVKLTECNAIHTYLAAKYNPELLGKTPSDQAKVVMMSNIIREAKQPAMVMPMYRGEKEKSLEEITKRVPAISAAIKGKFLIGDDPVWLDFFLFELIELAVFLTEGQVFKEYPNLVAYHKNVANLPGLKEYLESPDCIDKVREFNNKFAKVNGTAA